jgi:hypothetical protein
MAHERLHSTLPVMTTLIVAIQLGCLAPYKPTWKPPAPTTGASTEIHIVATFGGEPTDIVGHLYSENDGDRGADRCVRVYADRTWVLLDEHPGQEGLYDREVARGVVSEEGQLQVFPSEFTDEARGIWCKDGGRFAINGEKVPDTYGP